MPIQKKECYIEIWKGLTEVQKENMIKGAVNQLDAFNDLCFVDNRKKLSDVETYNPKFTLLDGKEKMLKMLFHIEYMSSKERVDRADRGSSIIDRLHFKRNILSAKSREEYKESILEWIMVKRGSLENSIFASTAIACNIKAATYVENFVMNLLVERLDRLYYTKYVISNIEEDKTVEKKKKKNKKRKKNKKKNNKKEEKSEVEQVKEVEEQLASDIEKTVKQDFKINFKGDPLLNNSDVSSKEHKNTLSDSIEEKKPKGLVTSEEETGEQGLCFNNLSFDNQVLMDKCSLDSIDKELKETEKILEAKEPAKEETAEVEETQEKDIEIT